MKIISKIGGIVGLPAALATAALFSVSCAQLDMAQNAYSAVRAGYGAKSAYESVKDLKEAEPVFAGYTAVLAYAELSPRDEKQAEAIKTAFADNLRYLVGEHGRAFGVALQACASTQGCGGRVLGVQFREDAYNASFAEKITMGNKLKGRLVFIDVATGRVFSEKRVEGVENYAGVLAMIRGSIAGAMIKSYPQSQPRPEALEAIPAVKPGYEKLMASA